MDVSVIVCTYNRARMLESNLAALAAQRTPATLAWEIVVVANNCTDDTETVVRRARKQCPVPLRLVLESRQGLSNARNRGITAASARYLAFTDDDTRPCVEWVATIFATFEGHDCFGVAGPVALDWPAPRPLWLADELLSSLAHADYGTLERDLDAPGTPPLGANMAFRREVFDKIGGFDPRLGRIGRKLLGGDETDLYERMLAAGLRVVYQPASLVRHAVEIERLRKGYFRRIYYYGGYSRGEKYTARVRRLGGIPVFAAGQVVHTTGRMLVAALRGERPRAFLRELNLWWLCGFAVGAARSHRRGVEGPV